MYVYLLPHAGQSVIERKNNLPLFTRSHDQKKYDLLSFAECKIYLVSILWTDKFSKYYVPKKKVRFNDQ